LEYLGLKTMKEEYANMLLSKNTEKANRIFNSPTDTPVTEPLEIHPEEEIQKEIIENQFTDIIVDMQSLNYEVLEATKNYTSLMTDIVTRLNAVDTALEAERNRIQDMNIICGNYNEFTTVKQIKTSDVYGTVGLLGDYIFTAHTDNASVGKFGVTFVEGNGFAGNKFVYNNKEYAINNMNTSNEQNIYDGDPLTIYEYSRLTSIGNKTETTPAEINFDKEEARCSINIRYEDTISMLHLDMDSHIILEDVLYSDDGIIYKSAWTTPKEINNINQSYIDPNYIYGTGVISFPPSQFIKLQLASNGATDDKLAFLFTDASNAQQPIERTIELPNAKRHVIRISDITAHVGTFSQGYLQTKELITNPVQSIAVFANEYIPEYFPDNKTYIQYILTVNGIDYDIVPINSEKTGTKVIRVSNYSIIDDYVVHINETIKSASLKVVINTMDSNVTPYVSNVKICFGKIGDRHELR
jgi:hypothetical protein